jgi:hypothetical protein
MQTFGDRIAAEFVRDVLADAGIQAFVQADHLGGGRPELAFTAGVCLIGQEAHAARHILVLDPDTRP